MKYRVEILLEAESVADAITKVAYPEGVELEGITYISVGEAEKEEW